MPICRVLSFFRNTGPVGFQGEQLVDDECVDSLEQTLQHRAVQRIDSRLVDQQRVEGLPEIDSQLDPHCLTLNLQRLPSPKIQSDNKIADDQQEILQKEPMGKLILEVAKVDASHGGQQLHNDQLGVGVPERNEQVVQHFGHVLLPQEDVEFLEFAEF